MWLDRSLKWGKHINEVVYKCSKFLNVIKVLAGSSWGVHMSHLRRLYLGLIRSRIDYACFLYDCGAKSNVSKLDRIQNQAMRVVGGFIKSSPIHVMESELHIAPLFVRRQYLAYKYLSKIKSWSMNSTIDLISDMSALCHIRYWRNKKKPLLAQIFEDVRQMDCISVETLRMFSFEIWLSAVDFQKCLEDKLESISLAKSRYEPNTLINNVLRELHTNYGSWHKLYTDGSKGTHGLGAGFFDQSCNYKAGFKITSNVSVMTLELIAIFQALSYIMTKNYKNIVIFTDSKSALQHVARCASGCRGASIAYDILNIILHFINNNIEIKLQWVPAHVGLRGNEEADQLSKLAAQEGVEFNFLPDYVDYLPKFRNKCFNNWQEHFNIISKEKGLWYKTIQGQLPRLPWFDKSTLSRNLVKLLLRLRCGHYPSAKFAFLMKKVNSPNCVSCNVIEDVQHLLMDCVRNQNQREILINEFKLNLLEVGLVQTILAQPNSDLAKRLAQLVHFVD